MTKKRNHTNINYTKKRKHTKRNYTKKRNHTKKRTRQRKKGGGLKSLKGVVGKLQGAAMGVAKNLKGTSVTNEDKSRCIAIFILTRDNLRRLFGITHDTSYDKDPFDPLDPFPANELEVKDDFIKRLLIHTLCYANLSDKLKKTFKRMVLDKYKDNLGYFKEFYYRAFLDIKRLLPGTNEIHPFSEYNYCGPGTDVTWRLNPDIVWMKKLLDHSLERKEIGTYPYDKPINNADKCCEQHDKMFGTHYIEGFDGETGKYTNNSKESELVADRAMLECLEKKKRQGETLSQKEEIIKRTILTKSFAQNTLKQSWTGKLGDKAFNALVFSDAVNLEKPVNNPEYKRQMREMSSNYDN